jgi:hypothetical protein
MRLKRTEYGCSPIVRIFRMLLAEETFAVLGGESGYDLGISKSEITISDAPCLVLQVGLIWLHQYVQKIKGM